MLQNTDLLICLVLVSSSIFSFRRLVTPNTLAGAMVVVENALYK